MLLLPTVTIKRLPEVAGVIEQANTDDRNAEIACRLQVVAREDAKTTGVLRERSCDAELWREIPNRTWRCFAQSLTPASAGEIVAQVICGSIHQTQELRIGCKLLKPLSVHLPEQTHRVSAHFVP
ncbi:unannotated protein [freshwater metagenome]|uniref:Unannotated protein n=1 Tax=freshwater metagenome TaxID=449393 RepID=A0A6J7I6N0_9ZZZZ